MAHAHDHPSTVVANWKHLTEESHRTLVVVRDNGGGEWNNEMTISQDVASHSTILPLLYVVV
jgi:hypothetical protein